jgi:NAD+-dependent secondary alcohol dehydrogenase Adh1
MKALRLHEYGQAPRLDDVPEPIITGPHDVIVKVAGAGLCRTDVHIRGAGSLRPFQLTSP